MLEEGRRGLGGASPRGTTRRHDGAVGPLDDLGWLSKRASFKSRERIRGVRVGVGEGVREGEIVREQRTGLRASSGRAIESFGGRGRGKQCCKSQVDLK